MLLLDYDAKEGQTPPCLARCALRQRAARPMKRLALSSFLIGGGRDDGYGGLLLHLAGALVLEYYAAEGIGAALPRRLYIKVTGLEVHNKFGSAIYPHWRRQRRRRQGAATLAGW